MGVQSSSASPDACRQRDRQTDMRTHKERPIGTTSKHQELLLFLITCPISYPLFPLPFALLLRMGLYILSPVLVLSFIFVIDEASRGDRVLNISPYMRPSSTTTISLLLYNLIHTSPGMLLYYQHNKGRGLINTAKIKLQFPVTKSKVGFCSGKLTVFPV